VLFYCTRFVTYRRTQRRTPFTPCHSAKQAAYVQHLSSLKWLNDVARFREWSSGIGNFREWNRDPRLGPQDIAHAFTAEREALSCILLTSNVSCDPQ
jgi:hypothetical protein